MGLGRVELPTSRLSGDPEPSSIPTFGRSSEGGPRDLPGSRIIETASERHQSTHQSTHQHASPLWPAIGEIGVTGRIGDIGEIGGITRAFNSLRASSSGQLERWPLCWQCATRQGSRVLLASKGCGDPPTAFFSYIRAVFDAGFHSSQNRQGARGQQGAPQAPRTARRTLCRLPVPA